MKKILLAAALLAVTFPAFADDFETCSSAPATLPVGQPDSRGQMPSGTVTPAEMSTARQHQAPRRAEDESNTFTVQTEEGVSMVFKVVSEADRTCQVGSGRNWYASCAIDQKTEGTVTIPAEANGYQVIGIGQGAFQGCSNITHLILPPTIEYIDYYGISGNAALQELNIPAATTTINDYAFGANSSLLRFTVDAGNVNFSARGGMLMSYDGRTLLAFPSGLPGECTIPADIPYVNSGAFVGCQLTKLTFPATVQWVGGWVATNCPNLTTLVWECGQTALSYCGFRYNSNLEHIELAEGLTTIPVECFSGAAVRDVILPTTVQSVANFAFGGCRYLERIEFSTKMTAIASPYAFQYDTNLTDIVIKFKSKALFRNTLPVDAFPEEVFQNATLHVPTGTASFFQTTEGWNQFQTLVEEGDPVSYEDEQAEGDLWGYYADEALYDFFVRRNYVSQTNVAIHLPGDETLVGAQVTAIRVAAHSQTTTQMEGGTAWLATELDGAHLAEVEMVDIEGGRYVELVLPQPYTITSEGVFVGLSCQGTPWLNALRGGTEGGFYQQLDDGEWVSDAYGYALAIQVRVKDHHLPQAQATFGAPDRTLTMPEQLSLIAIDVRNEGQEPIQNIDYTMTVDGISEQHHMDIYVAPGIGRRESVTIGVTGPAQPGTFDVSFAIDQVNGKTNTNARTDTYTFTNLAHAVERRTVVEEGTGTWCGWCTRGFAGMRLAREQFGDRFIGIAVHRPYSGNTGIDPMDVGYYGASFNSFPSCYIDRADALFDPYGNLLSIEAALAVTPSVDVSVTGVWNADKTQVTLTSQTEFLAAGDGYQVAYCLVADGLTGPSPEWDQTNYYAYYPEYASDPNLAPYVEAGDPISGMTFNDVLIASSYQTEYDALRPFGTVEAGSTKHHTWELPLPTSQLLSDAIDKSQVYAVVLVLNADGTMANAAKALVTDVDLGVQSLTTGRSTEDHTVYSLSGVRMATGTDTTRQLPSGIYVVGGRKVAVK